MPENDQKRMRINLSYEENNEYNTAVSFLIVEPPNKLYKLTFAFIALLNDLCCVRFRRLLSEHTVRKSRKITRQN